MKKEFLRIRDAVQIGSWEELQAQPLSTITKRDEDTELLDGLIVKGYETKFSNGINENYETYDKGALDKFVQEYFVDKKLNLPVDVQHAGSMQPDWLVGRVVYLEVNNTGFYFVAYIPRKHPKYEQVHMMLQEGILQGFSKEGWATDWETIRDEKGNWIGDKITEFKLTCMSLVATPANGVPFEKLQEVKRDGLRFVKIQDTEEQQGDLGLFL